MWQSNACWKRPKTRVRRGGRALNDIMDRILQDKLHSRLWSSLMRQNNTINRADVNKVLGDVEPLSSTIHEVGMAAVAAELHLGIDELELDAADTVERGAA